MTMLEDPPNLITDKTANEWWNPDATTSDDNDAISAMLDTLFAHEADEKRDYPHELAALIANVFTQTASGPRLTFSVNAGDGSTLTALDPAYCFGIEPNEKKSRKRQGRYQSIVGQLSKVSNLLFPLHLELYDTVVHLDRDDTEETLDFLNANMDEDCFAAYVLPAENLDLAKTMTSHPGVYCGIQTDEFFVFFANDPDRMKEPDPMARPIQVREASRQMLDLMSPWVEEQRKLHASYSDYRYTNKGQTQSYKQAWTAIHREYGRRFLREAKVYDIELVGKRVIDFQPSEWCKLALERSGSNVGQRLHRKDISYFAQHSGMWRELLIMKDEGTILIDPLVIEAIAPVIEEAARATTPLRALKLQERLAYLNMQSKVKCVRSDPEREFEEGRWYGVSIRDHEYFKHFTKNESVKGHLTLVEKRRRYVRQDIWIGGEVFNDDNAVHIEYLLKHFDVPDPGDVRTRYPDEIAVQDAHVLALEEEFLTPRGLAFKAYQRRDLAAISVNDRGILGWQQGLGKTPGGLLFAKIAERKRQKDLPVLIVCPQDLIPQWIAEAKKFFGIDLHWIGRHKGKHASSAIEVYTPDGPVSVAGGAVKNIIEARAIDKQIREGAGGYYITHYEALTTGGAKNLMKLAEPYVIRIEKDEKWVSPGYRTLEDGTKKWFEGEWQTVEKEITTAQECPECGSQLFGPACRGHIKLDSEAGTTRYGRRCTWNRYIYRLPSIGQILSTTFKDGVIVVDEGTQIASAKNSTETDASQKTKAIVGMRARHRLVMSGTPVKNFIAQAFWLLWWGVGGRERGADGSKNWSSRFPYAFSGGKSDFAKDYTVVEWTKNDDTGNWAGQKHVGEVTNHSRLWQQFAAVLLRRTKEETGELIPLKAVHPVYVPLGYHQREQMDSWIRHFPELYAEKHPNDPKVKRGVHIRMAPMLGLDVKLNYASVLPETDPDWEWTTVPVQNFTPAALKALELTMALVKQERRVLVGTDVKKATAWLSARLNSKGIRTKTMLKPNGSGDTLDPRDRAEVVRQFQEGEMDVLISTQKAIRLGHNLDKGSAVVLFGLDWDYETFAQFTERVHRLTSERPVDIYVIVSGAEGLTMLGRKWDVIRDKSKGAAMAIDGKLPEQHEDPVDIAEIVREMMERGIPASGNEIAETKIAEEWSRVPAIEAFKIPDGFETDQAKPWIIDWDAANAALEERLAVEQEYRDMWLPDPDGLREFADACRASVDAAICDGLEALFAIDLSEVTNVTNSPEGEIFPDDLPGSEPAETSAAGVDEPESNSGSDTASPATPPIDGQLSFEELEEPEATDQLGHRNPAPPVDHMGQLKQAKELFDLGVLSQEEFDDLKATLLAALKEAA